MDAIEFREVAMGNLDEIIKIEVRPDQTGLVADNLYSIAQAGLDPCGWCRGIYVEEKPVGFFFVKELEAGSLFLSMPLHDRPKSPKKRSGTKSNAATCQPDLFFSTRKNDRFSCW